jgi:FemAB-related protein (PEP-CTERM system-associated)
MLTSVPFHNYGGVVADDETAAGKLLDSATEIAREHRCRHVELRHVSRQFPQLPAREHKVTMLLPLGPGMWERLDRKVRNQIRKAQKSGLTVERGGSELLGDFYKVFARNMRDLGTPVYPRRLFEEVLDAFPDRASLHVIHLQGQPVAAGLVYRTRTRVEVPSASSIRDFNNLCPNVLLYWSVIETAVAEGCQLLDFGRSTPNDGTYKFKSQWGAEPHALHWEYVLAPGKTFPHVSPANPKFSLAIELWKRMPIPIANRIGPRIVRAIP